MPIILTTCSCGQRLELDAAHTLILTGSTEAVWRAIRATATPGQIIDPQVVADYSFLSRRWVYEQLHRLADYNLLISRKKRKDKRGKPDPRGKHHEWILPSKPLPIVLSGRTIRGKVA